MQDVGPSFATVVLSGFLGLLSGGGRIWYIETFWRPRRVRQRVAAVLVRELAMNRRTLAHMKPKVRNTATEAIIPVDFAFSRVGLQSAGLELGELPPEVVSDVIGFYKFIDHLDRVFGSYERSTDALATMENRTSVLAQEAIANKRSAVELFSKELDEAIRWCDTAMEQLGTIADDPDWRHWQEDREAMLAHDPNLKRTEAPSLKPRRPPDAADPSANERPPA
jgi:hypothetical protein